MERTPKKVRLCLPIAATTWLVFELQCHKNTLELSISVWWKTAIKVINQMCAFISTYDMHKKNKKNASRFEAKQKRPFFDTYKALRSKCVCVCLVCVTENDWLCVALLPYTCQIVRLSGRLIHSNPKWNRWVKYAYIKLMLYVSVWALSFSI